MSPCARGAVVIGAHINALGVVRSLAAMDIPCAVISTEPYDIAQHSRFAVMQESVRGNGNQADAIVELLEHRAAQWRGWAIIPTTDPAIEALANHGERLASTYRLIAAPPDAARCLLDKQSMLDAAKAVGMSLPHCYGSAHRATLAVNHFQFPVVVKSTSAYAFFKAFGCKLLVARDPLELKDCVARVESAQIPCRLFELIPGADDRIYVYCVYMDARGEPVGGVTIRKLRQSPPFFGVARVAEITREIPELRDATIALLRRIGYRGMAAAEFKLDERTGIYRFMEINGRSVIYNRLIRRAGVDLVAMAWRDQILGEREAPNPNQWPGVWINLHADVLHSIFSRRRDPISFERFAAPYDRPIEEAVWSPDDPRPFLAQWSRTLQEAFTSAPSTSR